jgi:hypothetical protein
LPRAREKPSEDSQLIEGALALIRADFHQILETRSVLAGSERHAVVRAEDAALLLDWRPQSNIQTASSRWIGSAKSPTLALPRELTKRITRHNDDKCELVHTWYEFPKAQAPRKSSLGLRLRVYSMTELAGAQASRLG